MTESYVFRKIVMHVLWLNHFHRGSVMVSLDRAMTGSYRLSIATMSLSAAVWPQF